MKKFLITTIAALAISVSAYSQKSVTIKPVSADSIPTFTKKASDLPYVQNVQVYHGGKDLLKQPSFGFTIDVIPYVGDVYYIAYDKKIGFITFAVFMPKYSLWHINEKFVHLLKFK